MRFYLAVAMVCLGACAQTPNLALTNLKEFGKSPDLAEPEVSLLPTAKIARALGFRAGEAPRPAAGWTVNRFAEGLVHPRWLLELPNGDVLVAETDTPQNSGGFDGIKGLAAKLIMRYGGSNRGSADRIRLLRDADGDGVAERSVTLLEDLHSPFGMAYRDGSLYVANTDALLRFPYELGEEYVAGPAEHLTDLPALPYNHHWTKSLLLDSTGRRLWIGVGSNSNIAENGMENEEMRAAILQYDIESGELSVYASGLRNPVGMALHPETGELWTVVNERDELGDQLVPDYLTEVIEDEFYGWPVWYMGGNKDERVLAMGIDNDTRVREPDYALGAHTASLGLDFYDYPHPSLRHAAIIGQRGSWNRSQFAGYKVIAVQFDAGRPKDALPITLLDGFLNEKGQARGRPVGVQVLGDGAIVVADDVAGIVWRLAPAVSPK
jgi:glucose/arabinose dehydrogenase